MTRRDNNITEMALLETAKIVSPAKMPKLKDILIGEIHDKLKTARLYLNNYFIKKIIYAEELKQIKIYLLVELCPTLEEGVKARAGLKRNGFIFLDKGDFSGFILGAHMPIPLHVFDNIFFSLDFNVTGDFFIAREVA